MEPNKNKQNTKDADPPQPLRNLMVPLYFLSLIQGKRS